jgi:hypothetical protein
MRGKRQTTKASTRNRSKAMKSAQSDERKPKAHTEKGIKEPEDTAKHHGSILFIMKTN